MKPATDAELIAVWQAAPGFNFARRAIYDLGVEHGRQQAAEERPLWPDPITDRPPTEADGDKNGYVQIFEENVWKPFSRFDAAECGIPWRHTPRWQPKPPTLKEQALADLEANSTAYPGLPWDNIRRALEAQP